MFMFDIETLGIETSSVILSAALIKFNDEQSYQELLDAAIFVKFSVKEQIEIYKRTVDKSTLDWWKTQNQKSLKKSFVPSVNDLNFLDGAQLISDYFNNNKSSKNDLIWTRGHFDEIIYGNLCRTAGIESFAHFGSFRDVRTAIDILSNESKRGYCPVYFKGFDVSKVEKHDPVHDCAYDIMQLCHFMPKD